MGDIYFSFRGRVYINAEALNMVESIGNYVKHRRIPVVIPESYVTYMVPAISGESIAHGYQYVLAQKAVEKGLPVCKLCKNGIFLKSTNDEVFMDSFGKKELPNTPEKLEEEIVKGCVVEDIGGFLFAGEKKTTKVKNLKRTSNFYVGYMIPVAEALMNTVIEPQLHTRYALGTKYVEKRGQMIYYVEIASAPYVFSFDLDTRYIGRSTYSIETAGKPLVGEEEIKERKILALETFAEFITEMMFGAKKTRFLPVIEWESFVAAVSDKPWIVPSSFTKKYIENAEKKLEKINKNTKLYIYKRDGEKSFEETLYEAIEDAEKRITQ